MKKYIISTLLLVMLIVASCKTKNISQPMSISKLITYTDQYNTDCSSKLKHDGEETVVGAYIQKINTFANENRFQIFENADIGSIRIDVDVINNSKDVFDKISQQLSKLSENDFTQIKVKGIISGKALHMNGKCKMGLLLTISSPDNIKF